MPSGLRELLVGLCRGRESATEELLRPDRLWASVWRVLLLIVVCGGAYGGAIGYWRSPVQAVFAAVKFPLLLVLTAAGNVLVNGMVGQLLGSGLSIRQTTVAILASFAVLAAAVGSLAPVALFITLNLPAADVPGAAWQSVRLLIVMHTGIIAAAGIAATLRLRELVTRTAIPGRAPLILVVWLATNLFFGAQLSWNLRPYFGSPSLPVRFIRDNPFDGTFYGAVFRAAVGLVQPNSVLPPPLVTSPQEKQP